jgi:hypothetical protein
MSNKNNTYCSILKDNCDGFKRKNCKDCIVYKKAIKDAWQRHTYSC